MKITNDYKIYQSDNFRVRLLKSNEPFTSSHVRKFTVLLLRVFVLDKDKFRESKKTSISPYFTHSFSEKFLFLPCSAPIFLVFDNKGAISDTSIFLQVEKIVKILDVLRNIQKLNEKEFYKTYSKKKD